MAVGTPSPTCYDPMAQAVQGVPVGDPDWYEALEERYGYIGGALGPGAGQVQLDALWLDYATTHPGASPCKIRWDDSGNFVTLTEPLDFGLELGFEVAQFHVPSVSLGVIERIGTFLRVQPLDPDGPAGPVVEYTGTISSVGDFDGSPAAFPVPHPAGGSDLLVRFELIQTDLSAYDGLPRPRRAVPPSQMPSYPVKVWNDNRYAWGTRYSENQKRVFDGHTALRLFVIVTAKEPEWRVKVGGYLAGYWQLGGPHREAYSSATTRI